jgi:hypothetical protein
VKYDDSNLESNAAANVAAWVDFSTMSEDGKTLLDQFTSWSVAWHAANVIFVQESALRYNAINAEDNNGISIWPMQWNDNRCRNIFNKVLASTWWENLIKTNIGQDFLSFITGEHKSDRSRDISNWWTWKRDKNGVFALENRKEWLDEWKNADIMNKLLIFLNTPELKWIMNEQIKSDISEWEADDGNGNVKSYMNVLWKDILGLSSIDSASDDQKKALVLCSRLYNANPAWTMSVLRQALRENNIGLDNLKTLFSKEGWIKWSTPDWSYDHNEIVDKTILYCNACLGRKPEASPEFSVWFTFNSYTWWSVDNIDDDTELKFSTSVWDKIVKINKNDKILSFDEMDFKITDDLVKFLVINSLKIEWENVICGHTLVMSSTIPLSEITAILTQASALKSSWTCNIKLAGKSLTLERMQ